MNTLYIYIRLYNNSYETILICIIHYMLYIGVAGTVHEVGHALYEQGRNPNYDNLPVSR